MVETLRKDMVRRAREENWGRILLQESSSNSPLFLPQEKLE